MLLASSSAAGYASHHVQIHLKLLTDGFIIHAIGGQQADYCCSLD
jgi:hypothetical protein